MGDTGSWGNNLLGVLGALLLTGFAAILGALLGLLYVRLFVPKTGMGWDQLADVLGGLMLGGLIGLVAGAVGVALMAPRRRALAAAICAVLTVALIVGFSVTAPARTQPSPPVVREEPFDPWFNVQIHIGHTEEILALDLPHAEPC